MTTLRASRALEPPYRSKWERWADFYLVNPPPTILNNPEEYWRIRRELRAEIERYGYVRGEQ